MDGIRKLASLQKILNIQPIPGADNIEVATVLGWNVVVRKNEFKVGDLVVYFEIDSLIPRNPWCEFLFKDIESKFSRLKTKKLRGQISQGLIIPIPEGISGSEGDDLTEILGVKKWELVIPAQLMGQVKGNFPHFLRKTDVERIQSSPRLMDEFKDKDVYVAIKMDGTSTTFYRHNEVVGVCSRNLELKPDAETAYWKMFNKYDIENKLNKLGRNIAIQCETHGPGIQKNRMGASEVSIAVFDVYDIDKQLYVGYDEMISICKELDIPTVAIIYRGIFKWNSVDELLALADEQKYANGSISEGIVIRPTEITYSECLKGRLSVKAISNKYLLKNEE